MTRFILANQATAAKRRIYFDCRDATDGITPETGEAGGQPQISTNGGAWTGTGIGTLSAIGQGRYYAELTSGAVASAGDIIETRFKSGNTAETPGDSVQVVAFDPDDATALGLGRLDATVSSRLAAGDISLSSGQVTVGSNTDKTGYSLSQAFPANFGDLAITASTGKVTVGANDDKSGYTISGTKTTLDALNDVTAAAVRTEMDANSADLDTIIGYVDALELRLTDARAGYLDNLNGHTPQSGDSFARIGAAGAGLTQVALAAEVRLKKNTAFNNFQFLMVDGTDYVTPLTGLTVSGQRAIDGAGFASLANGVSEVGNGLYRVNLAASDLNGDMVTLRFSATGAADTFVSIITQTD